jgi:hypothetical protein
MAKMQVKRVGMLSYAKMMAVTNAAFGLIIGVIYGLFIMIFGAALMAGGGRNATGGGVGVVIVGLLVMIGVPLFSAVVGFIAGVIGAGIYNVAAGFVGGIEIDLEAVADEYAAPPPPQWNATHQQPGQQHYPY